MSLQSYIIFLLFSICLLLKSNTRVVYNKKQSMKTFNTIKDLQKYINQLKYVQNKSIGIVPTMGALHKAHISLLHASQKDNDVTVCSIFVNPTQFNNEEDLKNYPNTIKNDLKLLEIGGCDILFIPSVEEIYPQKVSLKLFFGTIETELEGKHRPGHFNGVGIIISKLFNIVKPNRAYFGEKDFQQLAIIKKLNADLGFGVEVVGCSTLREENGLAISSRNFRLSENGKNVASVLYEILSQVKLDILNGLDVRDILEKEKNNISKNTEVDLEYLEVVDSITCLPEYSPKQNQRLNIATAAFVEGVRLIDNISFHL